MLRYFDNKNVEITIIILKIYIFMVMFITEIYFHFCVP